MATFVACSLPAGLTVEHDGIKINLNGANVGADEANPARNGGAPDSELRMHGHGITKLEGAQEEALDAWWKSVTLNPGGKPLQEPFAPIASGALRRFASEADLRKDVSRNEAHAIPGLNPDKDLPPGVETADDRETSDAPKKK